MEKMQLQSTANTWKWNRREDGSPANGKAIKFNGNNWSTELLLSHFKKNNKIPR